MVQNVISPSQETSRDQPEEAGQSIQGTQYSFLKFNNVAHNNIEFFLSLDSPKTGSGDHENVYNRGLNYTEIYENNGTLYGDCVKKAVHIREIRSHLPWYSSRNPVVFSDLNKSTKKFLNITVNEDLEDAMNSIQYSKAVNSTYGWEFNRNLSYKNTPSVFIALTKMLLK